MLTFLLMTFQLDFRTILSSCVSVGIRSNLRRMSSSEYSTSSSRARELPPEKQPPIFAVQVGKQFTGSPAQERKHGDPYRNRRRAQKATQNRLYWGAEMGVTFFARFPLSSFSFFASVSCSSARRLSVVACCFICLTFRGDRRLNEPRQERLSRQAVAASPPLPFPHAATGRVFSPPPISTRPLFPFQFLASGWGLQQGKRTYGVGNGMCGRSRHRLLP